MGNRSPRSCAFCCIHRKPKMDTARKLFLSWSSLKTNGLTSRAMVSKPIGNSGWAVFHMAFHKSSWSRRRGGQGFSRLLFRRIWLHQPEEWRRRLGFRCNRFFLRHSNCCSFGSISKGKSSSALPPTRARARGTKHHRIFCEPFAAPGESPPCYRISRGRKKSVHGVV